MTPVLPAAAGLHLSAAERERAYSPSSCIGGDYRPFVAAYRERSVQARQAAEALGGRWRRLAHGPAPAQGVEFCLPPGRPRGLLVFIHGGYWQELSAADSLFAAADCVAAGHAFAAIDYTLAPAASLAQIIAECRHAFALLHAQALALGVQPAHIVVAGSSAGAQLAAMLALGAARERPGALVLVSGIYWLEPLLGTSINAALGLDLHSARAASPALHALADVAPALLAWGEIETDAFKAQSEAFARALPVADCLELPQRNHFDVILDLADPATELGRRTHHLLTRQPTALR